MASKNTLRDTLLSRTSHPIWEGAAPSQPGTMPLAAAPNPVGGSMTASTGLPTPVPNQSQGVPPAWQRFLTGQRMQDAYRANWTPNPMIIRMLSGGQ